MAKVCKISLERVGKVGTRYSIIVHVDVGYSAQFRIGSIELNRDNDVAIIADLLNKGRLEFPTMVDKLIPAAIEDYTNIEAVGYKHGARLIEQGIQPLNWTNFNAVYPSPNGKMFQHYNIGFNRALRERHNPEQ